MHSLRPLFFAALLAGLIAGTGATILHHLGTVPLIVQAETYEPAAEAAGELAHDHSAGHAHEPEAWTPQDGAERIGFTVAADLLTGVAYALLLVGAFALRGGAMDWRKGLFWGLAGFAVFTLAPGLGLPPELPGTQAAPVTDRQIWWAGTALLTAGGLALIALLRRPLAVALGVVLILLPHGLGAPQPEVHAALAPAELTQRFILMVMGISLCFWLLLGGVSGWLYGRFSRTA